ncbi:hypothetical protein NLJ89_g5491 [Agrocybe chaxingu]|uniref:Uncharacterized protein n=1 Tax=Agrocybe chaxingu TaxID=84603 RepID=A0A9W8MTK0_9AGAR|nr:hypothetical protein NLJ89_g5491 [Agrocybe chaxingu]
MSARLTRTALSAARRGAQTTLSSTARVSRRAMSSSHAPATKSDKPWIIGSLLVFGPAFLYLVSPSARKDTHHVHNDKHDSPAHDKKENAEVKPAEVVIKDDEGTPAQVGASIALSEAVDVPKETQTPADLAELKKDAETESPPETAPEPTEVPSKAKSPEGISSEKSGTFQAEGEEGPTSQGKARQAAKEGVAPKEAAEAKN